MTSDGAKASVQKKRCCGRNTAERFHFRGHCVDGILIEKLWKSESVTMETISIPGLNGHSGQGVRVRSLVGKRRAGIFIWLHRFYVFLIDLMLVFILLLWCASC